MKNKLLALIALALSGCAATDGYMYQSYSTPEYSQSNALTYEPDQPRMIALDPYGHSATQMPNGLIIYSP